MDKFLLTPGPTDIAEATRMAMARPICNPDLDPEFFEFYRALCAKLQRLMHTKNDTLVLNGEGIMGLEAAVACLVEPGEEVLVLDNGFFGRGFADFVTMYGGKPVFLSKDYHQPILAEDLKEVLEQYPDIKVATLVHCDTPTAMLNPIEELVPLLKEHGVLSIVDVVASLAGNIVDVDACGIDICLGGSQKALSAPPGLTLISVSDAAWQKMRQRKTPVPGFYLNLLIWKDGWLAGKEEFPYTQPISDLFALDAALELALADGEEALFARHARVAAAVRHTFEQACFTLWPLKGYSANTVTAVEIPPGVKDEAAVRQKLWQKHGIMIGGSWGELAGKIWRIGHMGEGAREEKIFRFFLALEDVFREEGYPIAPMAEIFAKEMRTRIANDR